MTDQSTVNSVTVNIDGQEVQVPQGMNMIEAAASIKKEIPHYCYHPKLSVSGNCRMCLIEMGMPMRDRASGEAILDEDGKQKIGWMPKPAIGCATNAAEGMHIKTDSPLVKDCQNGVTEFLLVNHPLDCPICDQAGECTLQEFSADYGRGYSRFQEDKNVKPKRTRLGPRVTLDDERCILCSRCIRFSKEVAKDDVLGFTDRGSYSTLSCYPGKELSNNYSLNTVDICPVGALTSTDFRFKMRTWFLKQTPSICTESSVGVNTTVWSREGVIYRITPRQNDEVNDTWMPDSGRALYKTVEDETRIKQFALNRGRASCSETLERIKEVIYATNIAYIGSAKASVEEQFLLKQLTDLVPGPLHLVSHTGQSDDLLISEDRSPNLRGAFVTGLTETLPTTSLDDLKAQIESDQINCLLIHNEDIVAAGIPASLLKKINVIYMGTHANETSKAARVLIPTLTAFEKSGTFINQQFRIQKFEQAIPGPSGLLPDISILSQLIQLFDTQKHYEPSIQAIWPHMKDEIKELQDIDLAAIPATGQIIDSETWRDVPFPESKTLHHTPSSN